MNKQNIICTRCGLLKPPYALKFETKQSGERVYINYCADCETPDEKAQHNEDVQEQIRIGSLPEAEGFLKELE